MNCQYGLDTKIAISRLIEMSGRQTKLDEQFLKFYEEMGRLNPNKFELETRLCDIVSCGI